MIKFYVILGLRLICQAIVTTFSLNTVSESVCVCGGGNEWMIWRKEAEWYMTLRIHYPIVKKWSIKLFIILIYRTVFSF